MVAGVILPAGADFWVALQAGRIPEWRSEKYLAYVRTLPCVVTRETKGVQAHHIVGHGLKANGGRVSDMMVFPLHFEAHLPMYSGALHQLGHKEWERIHGDQRVFVFQTLVRAIHDGVLSC